MTSWPWAAAHWNTIPGPRSTLELSRGMVRAVKVASCILHQLMNGSENAMVK